MIEFIIIIAVCGIILAFYLGYKQADLKSENAELKDNETIRKRTDKIKSGVKRSDKTNFTDNTYSDN